MEEAYVRLLCPDCSKEWESTPSALPELAQSYECPTCDGNRPLAEFMRTEHDLQTVKSLG